jgi:hypothetical protein
MNLLFSPWTKASFHHHLSQPRSLCDSSGQRSAFVNRLLGDNDGSHFCGIGQSLDWILALYAAIE